MTDGLNSTSREIIRSAKRDIAEADLSIISRGLDDADDVKVTPQQIADARANNPSFSNLSNMAIKIALEKRANWEHRLFFQIISDEVLAADDLLDAVVVRKATRSEKYMDTQQTLDNFIAKLTEMQDFIRRYTQLVNEQVTTAWKATENEKMEGVIIAAHDYGCLYRETLNWSLEVLSWNVHQAFSNFLFLVSDSMLPVTTQMALWGLKCLSMMDNYALDVARPTDLNLGIVLNAGATDCLLPTFRQAAQEAQK